MLNSKEGVESVGNFIPGYVFFFNMANREKLQMSKQSISVNLVQNWQVARRTMKLLLPHCATNPFFICLTGSLRLAQKKGRK